MSIWSSIGHRDEVRGYGVDYQPEGEPAGWVDVATATPWNDCVRLAVIEPDENEGREAMVMLDRENAERLIRHLQTALGYISARNAKDAPPDPKV